MARSIAILGAGPAGLTLAGLLHRAQIGFTIFEKDESASWAFGGSGSGTLDLHAGSGLLAIKRLGLMDRFNKLASHKVPFTIADHQGNVCLQIEGEEDDDKPEIDRKDLRNLLLDAVPEHAVRWASKVKNVEMGKRNSISVHLADGSVHTGFDLIVGADGHRSKARSLASICGHIYSSPLSQDGCTAAKRSTIKQRNWLATDFTLPWDKIKAW